MSKILSRYMIFIAAAFLFTTPAIAVPLEGTADRPDPHSAQLDTDFDGYDSGVPHFRSYGDIPFIDPQDNMLVVEDQSDTGDFVDDSEKSNESENSQITSTIWFFCFALIGLLLIRRMSIKT